NQRNFLLNIDFNQSEKTQHRGRFVYNRQRQTDTAATLPAFFTLTPTDQRLFSYTLIHSFSSNMTNETRLAYRRSVNTVGLPDVAFPLPGFDSFPDISFTNLGLEIGPNDNAPQFTIENNYQVVNNLTYLVGNHSFKFGGDFRKLISPQTFVQRQRGDYIYANLEPFLFDNTPGFAERNVGANTYYGDQRLLFIFAQDDWRIRPNLTLNLGVNYAYQEVPFGAKQQSLNSIASVPGLIEFREPESQKKNFAPRVGFAYSPNFDSGFLGRLFGSSGKTSIRAGFSMAYDVIFDNLYILSSPPQFQQTIDAPAGLPNFLENGGIPNIIQPVANDPAAARAATSAFIPDQQVPYAITYTASIQRQFANDYSVEIRYLGTRGIHLLTQNRINIQSPVSNSPGNFLPTFLSAPSQSELDSMTTTLNQLQSRSNILPQFADAGFTNPIVTFLSNGNSTYHGGSVQVQKRLTNGLQFTGAYTYSHLIDDTTAEVLSTVLSPRRVQDFQNLSTERADSALDRRHRFVFSSLYELPFFRKSENAFLRRAFGGFNLSGTLSFESGEKITALSGNTQTNLTLPNPTPGERPIQINGLDSNLNADVVADRTILNPTGIQGTASTVTPLTNSAGQVVAYLANNPNAQYIQTGPGAFATTGRNTLQLPGINNLDFSVFKNFNVFGEGRFLQFRADFFNVFNHPQFTPGSVNGAELTAQSAGGVTALNNVNAINFNQPDRILTSHPRTIQFGLRFNF
ncbi:MAG: carboxypeptidase regulatory-like domain-containing protein, partial [Pyrinomonadaceae bacterium]